MSLLADGTAAAAGSFLMSLFRKGVSDITNTEILIHSGDRHNDGKLIRYKYNVNLAREEGRWFIKSDDAEKVLVGLKAIKQNAPPFVVEINVKDTMFKGMIW